MTQTPESRPETTTVTGQPRYGGRSDGPSRLSQVLAWVGIVAGVVFEKLLMVTKALISAVIALGVGVVVAAPAIADPKQCGPDLNASPFCGLSQSAPPPAGPAVPDQVTQGLQKGLKAMQGQR